MLPIWQGKLQVDSYLVVPGLYATLSYQDYHSNVVHYYNSPSTVILDPLCTMLTRKVSLRMTQFIGCIVSLIGIGLCGFATENWHVIILFGIVAGEIEALLPD